MMDECDDENVCLCLWLSLIVLLLAWGMLIFGISGQIIYGSGS